MKRSQVISLVAGAVAATATSARAQTAPETVRFGILGVEEAALPYYANEKGFFKAQGVNVELSLLGNGGSITQGIVSNALDVGVTNTGSITNAHIHGLPLYLLATGAVYSTRSPISHIAVGKNSPIKGAKDLNGKTVAVTTLRDMIQGTMLAWMEKNGGDWKTVNFIEMPGPQLAGGIQAKRTDAAIIVEPFYTAVKENLNTLGYSYSAVNDNKPFQTLGIAASQEWCRKNPATAKKVAAAIHEAARWANDPKNAAECASMIATFTKMDPAIIAGYPRLSFAEANRPELIQPVIDLLAKYSYIPHGFAASEVFVPGIS